MGSLGTERRPPVRRPEIPPGRALPALRLAPVPFSIAAFVVGAVVTALIIWSPFVAVGYRNASMHLVLDTLEACVALLVAYLVHGRFVRHRRLQDLLLTQGLVLLAVAGLGLTFATAAFPGTREGTIDIWLPVTIRLFGSLLIAAAALVNGRAVRSDWSRYLSLPVPLALILVAFTAFWAQRSELPVAFDRSGEPESAEHPLLTGHPALLIIQCAAAVCFFLAAIVFTAASARGSDQLLRYLGPACALGAFARVNYVLYPSLYTDWVYTGDFLRIGCYLLLLLGAGREIREYWAVQAAVAVLDDRRRLARELHDGVVQELALIRMESAGAEPGAVPRERIVRACDRALDEARAAIQALGRASDEPFGETLRRAAAELAQRYSVEVTVDVEDDLRLPDNVQHAVLRIVREAISNAVRHGKAASVTVCLHTTASGRALVIRDDGAGFDVPRAVAADAGFGLVSMRERAEEVHASFSVESSPGSGCVVRVTW